MEYRQSILFLHYSCPPVVGGVEEVVRQQAALFARYGHRVRVLAGSGEPFEEGVDVRIDPLLSSSHPKAKVFHGGQIEDRSAFESLIARIGGILESSLEGFEILIVHNVLSMHYNLPLTHAVHRLAEEGKISVIAWNHDSPLFNDDGTCRTPPENWRILTEANPSMRYVTITGARKDQFLALYGGGCRLEVVPNGIDPAAFFNLDPVISGAVRDRGLYESDLVIVQPSRLHPRKNIQFSIRVIKALADRGINATLLLPGSYDPHEEDTYRYRDELMDLAGELDVGHRVLIVADLFRDRGMEPSVPKRNVHDLYLISDLMFLPSLQEGFGIPLLEAGMFKLPILCSDIAPFREVCRDEVCMFSADETADGVAGRILDLVNSLPSHRMYRNVVRNYLWENIYRQRIKPLLDEVSGG